MKTNTEATMFAAIDNENVIWGTGDSEESAMLDARHWLGLNHEDGSEVMNTLVVEPCTQELVDAVKAVDGKIGWEWSGTIPRYMQVAADI